MLASRFWFIYVSVLLSVWVIILFIFIGLGMCMGIGLGKVIGILLMFIEIGVMCLVEVIQVSFMCLSR
jgi:hypothetical protein